MPSMLVALAIGILVGAASVLAVFGPNVLRRRRFLRAIPDVAAKLKLRHFINPSDAGGDWAMGGWLNGRCVLAEADDTGTIFAWLNRSNPLESDSPAQTGRPATLRAAIPEVATLSEASPSSDQDRGWSQMEGFFDRWGPYLLDFVVDREHLAFAFAVETHPKHTRGVRALAGEDLGDLASGFAAFTDEFEKMVDRFADSEDRYDVRDHTCQVCDIPSKNRSSICPHCGKRTGH